MTELCKIAPNILNIPNFECWNNFLNKLEESDDYILEQDIKYASDLATLIKFTCKHYNVFVIGREIFITTAGIQQERKLLIANGLVIIDLTFDFAKQAVFFEKFEKDLGDDCVKVVPLNEFAASLIDKINCDVKLCKYFGFKKVSNNGCQ